jgi:scyllo-inositol 2-dehydrogenase (NADP+)
MKKIKIALIGYGMSGRQFHLPAFVNHPNYELKSVMTRNPVNQRDVKAACPNVQIVEDYNKILNDDEIDLIVITTSNDVHYSYTKKALLKGKHVVCEKPFVETYAEALELFQFAEEKHLILRVFHNRKYDGDILTLQELMKTRDFGKIQTFSTRFDRYIPNIRDNWRFKDTVMSGLFYDLAPHLTHHAISLFGLPKSVFLNLFYEREGSVANDHFELTLYYESMVCFIGAEVFERELKPRFALVGTNASYFKYDFDSPDSVNVKTDELYQNNDLRSVFKTDPDTEENIPLLKGQHYRFYDLLAEHINNWPKEDIDKENALGVVQVMEKAMKSYQTKQIINI